jgi:hypothetical protein
VLALLRRSSASIANWLLSDFSKAINDGDLAEESGDDLSDVICEPMKERVDTTDPTYRYRGLSEEPV